MDGSVVRLGERRSFRLSCEYSYIVVAFLALSALPITVVESVSVSDVADFYDFSREVVHDVFKAWEVVGPHYMEDKITPPLLKSKEKKIIERITLITGRIAYAEDHILTGTLAAIGELQHDLPKIVRLELRLDSLLEKTSIIEAAHQSFTEYVTSNIYNKSERAQNTVNFESYTLQNFAENVVSHKAGSVQGVMEQLHYLVAPSTWQQQLLANEGGILRQIRKALQETSTNLCNVQQSPQQLIYNIYLSLQMTQLKGYTMMQFSWMLLRLYNKGNFTVESTKNREKYIERMRLQVQMAKKAMADSDQAIWRCDPEEQKLEETHTQITRLLQGYIQNEIDMNNDESCRENCNYYSYTKQFGCYKNQFCSQQRGCNGRIVDCKYLDSDMTICQSESDDVRYNWIRYENGNNLGDTSKKCSKKTTVDSWWRYLFWHCSYCFCLCDDPYFSDRYFNLRPVTSDIENNKVITAVRFIKVDHIIHLQIEEGEMLPKGGIDESTVAWRKVDQYKTGSTGIKDKDYHMLSWEERGIDLDEIKAPSNQVMTGIKFRKIGSHLNLEIRITPFNFTTGKLIQPNARSEWISNDNTDGASNSPRTEVKLEKPDVPTKHPKNTPLSHHDQFMLFTHTDMYKDVAQHTVPYIDTQVVRPQPPTPLSGAGLMFRGTTGSGGYIAPKVFTYNYADHLQENFEELPDRQKEKYEL